MTGSAQAAGGGVLSDLRRALDRLTRPPLAGYAAAFIFILLLGVVGLHLAGLRAPSGGRIETGTGDFLAFWTGAVMIHDGDAGVLYDFAEQRHTQSEILGGRSPQFQPYLNPPLLAVLLSGLVPLGFVRAFYVYDLACIAALAAGVAMLLRAAPQIRARPAGAWTLAILAMSWQPMLQTTLGGQNTPLTFALLAALALSLARDREIWSVIALGLLSYKPQYAVGAGLALLLAGRWKVAAGGAAIGALHWLLGAVIIGAAWPLRMLELMRAYRPMELTDNAETHFSWVRTADFLLPTPLDSIAAAAGVVAVLAAWWRFRALGRRGSTAAPNRPDEFAAWFALVLCGTMLVSPHQQYYDAALLVLPAALLVEHGLAAGRELGLAARLALAAAYVGYPLWAWADTLGIQPLFFALLGVSVWALRRCEDSLRGSSVLRPSGARSAAG